MKKIIRALMKVLIVCLFVIPMFSCGMQEISAENIPQAGWKHNSKGWWYRNEDGSWPADRWMKIDGSWYHFDEKGYMQTGWLFDEGYWYYLRSGGKMASGWVKSKGVWYHMAKSGKMQNNGWFKIRGKWYYLNKDGAMHTGWLSWKNKRYYLRESGEMACGDQIIEGKSYSFDQTGALISGPEDEIIKVRLEIPQSVQENGHYCGPACLQMVLSYKGIERTQDELAGELNTSMVTGTEYADMARVLNTYLFDCEVPEAGQPGYRAEYLVPGTVTEDVMETLKERVLRDIRADDPVFIAVNMHELYPELPSANHFVVITGYQMLDDEILYYYVVDPYWKVQSGTYQGLKIFTPAEIQKALDTNTEPAYVW